MQEQPDMRLRSELAEAPEQRQETASLRYDIIEALQRTPDGLTDVDIAGRTGSDLETIRGTMSDLAEAQLVEIVAPVQSGPVAPDESAPAQTYRLLAI